MQAANENVTRATIANAAEMVVGSMKMVRVGSRRVALVRTSTGFHALDNACPHEGYGLVQGALDGELLTCEWHNWKFAVTDGSCVLGEEGVASHTVEVVGNDVSISVVSPTDAQLRAQALASLQRGIDTAYNGQMARDALRMMHAGADPLEIVWEGIARTAPRFEYGFDHALAMTADCLTAMANLHGDERLGPVMQALSGLAEESLRLPDRVRPQPTRFDADALANNGPDEYWRLVEAEKSDDADALLTGALLAGLARDEAARWMIRPTCDHHLAFGHGAIYTQKAFELLDILGWDHASELLAHLTLMHVVSTREDRLPYMRPFLKAVDASGLTDRWADRADPAWSPTALIEVLIGDDQTAAVAACVTAITDGAGFDGLLNAVALAASTRLLQHDLDFERIPDASGHGWLNLTHSLTYANAARWAFTTDPGPHTARLVLYTVFHVVDNGRYVGPRIYVPPQARGLPLSDAIMFGDFEAAAAAALREPIRKVVDKLVKASLDDRSGALIVVAHHIKTVRAAIREAQITGSRLPLAAAARYLAAPARQRFVGNAVRRATYFLNTGNPPPR